MSDQLSDVDLFSDGTLRDPYPLYRRLRETGPAVWLPRHRVWAIGRYDDVREALRDWQTFSSVGGLGMVAVDDVSRTGVLVSTDPPEHDRVRDVIRPVFGPRALTRLSARVEELAGALVDDLAARGRFDGVTEFAETLPVTVVADLLGLPPGEDRGRLLAWANAMFDLNAPAGGRAEDDFRLAGELAAYVAGVLARGDFARGTLGAVLVEARDAGLVSPQDAFSVLFGVTIAGMDTTVNGVGTALHLLATHPRQWQALAGDPNLAADTWEEALRFDAPVQLFFRAVTRDADVGGVTVPAGSRACVMYASANRDSRRFSDPDTFDVRRARRDHLAFGHGVHACVGATLARLEGRALLAALARRVGELEPAGEPERRLNNVARGFARLPLTVQRR